MIEQRLGIVVTSACNLQCKYCCIAPRVARQPPWAAVRASLDAMIRSAPERLRVTFTGGEPLLAFATLRRAVSYVERRMDPARVRWVVITNGLLLQGDALTFLDAHRFLVNLSFDGVPAAQALRGRATHARLDRLLDLLQQDYAELFRERLKVCFTLSPPAVACLADSVAYFIEKGVKTFSISPVSSDAGWSLDRIAEMDRQFDRLSAGILHHYQATGEVPFALFRKSASVAKAATPTRACGVAEGRGFVVDVDGNAYACFPATHTYQPDPPQGLRADVTLLRLGPPEAPDFEKRCQAMRGAAASSSTFQSRGRYYSSYRKCSDCEFMTRCNFCPLACGPTRDDDDKYRVSDFLCAFTQVALAHRDRFPCQPTAFDFLSGSVPLTSLPPFGTGTRPEPPS